jgi:hypothetical protein
MRHSFWDHLGEALLMAAGMFWDVPLHAAVISCCVLPVARART